MGGELGGMGLGVKCMGGVLDGMGWVGLTRPDPT